jgi:hypothetical protein
MLALGMLGSASASSTAPAMASGHGGRSVGNICTSGLLVAAIMVLTFHTLLFHALVGGSPPSGPDSAAARAVRAFPSTTFGLWNWLDHWFRANPNAAIAWARWAQPHSPNPVIFHIRAAQYLNVHGQHAAALAELDFAIAKAHGLTRPSIVEMKRAMTAPAP